MSPVSNRQVQLHALDGWRGVTAMMVVLFHQFTTHSFFFHHWLRFMAPVLEFFFIVSGFVMALGFGGKIKDGPEFWGFLIRRAGRVWPLHLAMLGLLLLIPLIRLLADKQAFSGILSLESLPYQVLILQTWWEEMALTWNFPSWTLTGELFAYLVMGCLSSSPGMSE